MNITSQLLLVFSSVKAPTVSQQSLIFDTHSINWFVDTLSNTCRNCFPRRVYATNSCF